jgi:hypothetical protein
MNRDLSNCMKEAETQSVRQLQLLLDECANVSNPLQHIHNESQATLATASMSSIHSHSACALDDDDCSLSDSSFFGDFIPVNFDVRADDEFEDQDTPLHNSMPCLRAEEASLQETSEDIPRQGRDLFSDYRDRQCLDGSDHFRRSEEYLNIVDDQDICVCPMPYQDNMGQGFDGQGSLLSLEETFGNLNACMERTSQFREMVKRLTAEASKPIVPATTMFESCNSFQAFRNCNSSQHSSRTRQQKSSPILSQSAHNPNRPMKSRKSLLKPKSSYRHSSTQKKESRTKNSRSTGMRPVNWDLLVM